MTADPTAPGSIVITGAAGGIGRATAVRFAREGASVTLVDLAGSDLEARSPRWSAPAAPPSPLRRPTLIPTSAPPSTASAPSTPSSTTPGSKGFVGSMLECPKAEFDRVMAVNVNGVWLGMRAVIPSMRAQHRRAIVNGSSVAGLSGSTNLAAYSASKHAVIGLTKSTALEFVHDGVRGKCINPSPIETGMMRAIERGVDPDAPEAAHVRMASNNPTGRYGEPEEIVEVVAFPCSDAASYLNGVVLPVDGGRRAR